MSQAVKMKNVCFSIPQYNFAKYQPSMPARFLTDVRRLLPNKTEYGGSARP